MTLHNHIPVEAASSQKEHLWQQISSLPYFRGLLRAVEARFYENIELPAPTLDLGCGDGHFASLAFTRKLEVGIDPWEAPLRQAAKTGAYQTLIKGSGDRLPFDDSHFASAVSNSVLEHIPDLEHVIHEVARVLKPGAPFVFCVPNHNFLTNLSISTFFDRIGLKKLGESYRNFFNNISRHHHCDDPETWRMRLEASGFELVDWWHYFSPRSLHVLEWGHYLGLPSLVTKRFFGRWILVPKHWNLFLVEQITKRPYNEPSLQPEGSYTFYIARRK
jgi:ubiquinone/menaquinone biosynthesis C-methylase UbiE